MRAKQGKMVFGYSTNAFVKFDLFDAVDRIARLGFMGVEIMGDRPHLYPPDFDERRLDDLKKSLDHYGLKITNLNSFTLFAVGDTYLPSWIEPQVDRRRIRIEHTLQCLRVAARLGCGNISVPPGGPLPAGVSRAEAEGLFQRGLEQVLPLAEELKVRVLVEPEPGLLLENSRQFRDFIQDVASPWVGLNFDMGHFFCVGEDPVAAFEDLFPWVGHVHLEDIGPDRSHNHLIPGLGALDFPRIFEAMGRLGYEGDISLELYPYVDMPDEAGRRGLAHILPLLREAGLA
jgi:sugar phosphate isomerase/epimerase